MDDGTSPCPVPFSVMKKSASLRTGSALRNFSSYQGVFTITRPPMSSEIMYSATVLGMCNLRSERRIISLDRLSKAFDMSQLDKYRSLLNSFADSIVLII